MVAFPGYKDATENINCLGPKGGRSTGGAVQGSLGPLGADL